MRGLGMRGLFKKNNIPYADKRRLRFTLANTKPRGHIRTTGYPGCCCDRRNRSRSSLHANGEPVLGRRHKCENKLLST